MNLVKLKKSCILMLVALIWGIAFVAQSKGGDAIGPYSFNCIRFFMGGIVLLPVIWGLDRIEKTPRKPRTKQERKILIVAGILCGMALALASSAQQLGIYYGTPAGKAGFLTACYILMVPVIGIFFKRKCSWKLWVGILFACAGLYLLCMNGTLSFQTSDLLELLGALLFSIQIMLVDYYAPKVDGVRLSCIQFFVSGIVCGIPMFFLEMKHSVSGIVLWSQTLMTLDAWIPLIYAGCLSCGVAYTLQIIGQEGLNPTLASLLMSFESVFSVLAGWILLKEYFTIRELAGCALMFVAIVIAQVAVPQTESVSEESVTN